jgi:predicted  nucleic acid-binding Zn-ribbon protein
MVTDVDVRNWFPRISPFFILDRRRFLAVFEKAKISLKEMQDFLTKEYVKTKTLEETFQLIDKLNALEDQLASLKERKAKAASEKALVEKEIAETQQKMTDLKNKGGISQLDQIAIEIEALNSEIRQGLHHLQKPFLKLQSLTLHGEGSGLTPEEAQKLNQYLENPFEALGSEDYGYPLLKQILHKTASLMADGRLKLKPDKMRKAEQTIRSILEEVSLENHYNKAVDALTRRRQLSSSTQLTETKSDLSKLQEQIANLEMRKNNVKTEESLLERGCSETLEKIRNHKSQIEKNVLSFMDTKIHIE